MAPPLHEGHGLSTDISADFTTHTDTDTHTVETTQSAVVDLVDNLCRYLEQCVLLRWWMEVSRSETWWWWNLQPPTASDRQHPLLFTRYTHLLFVAIMLL